MADDRDWAPIMAVMANLYGFKPWDVERLTEEQLQMYLSQSGPTRLMVALPQLQATFGKYDAEARQKLIDHANRPHNPDSLDSRAWRVFIRQYQTDQDEAEKAEAEALPLSQAAAAALVAMIESQELTRTYEMGSLIWRLRIQPVWHRLVATASPPRVSSS